MEKNTNNTNYNKQTNFECFICLDVPKRPVAITCGHIFCWSCLQKWISGKSTLLCPVCRNGIDMNRVISLYTGNQDSNEKDDRPKVERISPGTNNRSYFRSFLDSIGYFGHGPNDINNAPLNQNEVLANQMALIFFILGMLIIFSIFYQF